MDNRTQLIEKYRTDFLNKLDSVRKGRRMSLLAIIFGLLVSIIVAIFGGILSEADWDFIGMIVSIIGAGGIGLCLWGFFICYLGEDRRQYKEEVKKLQSKIDNIEAYTDKEIEKMQFREKAKKEKEQKQLELQLKENALIKEHGEPIKSVTLYKGFGNSLFNNKVCVFKDDFVAIEGKFYKFSDILSVDYEDDVHTVNTSTSTSNGTSKTNNSNMALRSGVGYVVGGAAGAIIGGSTAKRGIETTSTTTTSTETKHNYEIIITLNNFENPQIVLKFWKNRAAYYELKSIFTIILNKNKNM